MKFILFNVQDKSKSEINKIELDSNCYINEVVFSKSTLNSMNNEPRRILEKMKYKYYDIKIEKIILKALDSYDKKWYYILSKNINVSNKYLSNKLEQLLGYKLSKTNEMDNNVFRYIDEYVSKNEQLKSYEVKVLLVVTNSKNLNITLLLNLIRKFKSVNIYLKDAPSEYILKRIKQINKTEGTTIEILKKERKSFIDYNVIYFVDDFKENYPRFRLNKSSQVIDLETTNQDKYNSNLIYLKEFTNKQNVNVKNIDELKLKYDNLELARVVNKITNVLDKS